MVEDEEAELAAWVLRCESKAEGISFSSLSPGERGGRQSSGEAGERLPGAEDGVGGSEGGKVRLSPSGTHYVQLGRVRAE